MIRLRVFLYSAGLMATATIGAGLFALPYVFGRAGWVLGIMYMAVLMGFVAFAHNLYWRTLYHVREKQRLLGLTRTYLGVGASYLAFAAIIGGLLLALLIYLILAANFLAIIFPGVGAWGVLFFWALSSLPVFLNLKRFIVFELVGGALVLSIISIIFFSGVNGGAHALPQAVDLNNFFLPFGVVVFALAGWTAVEPIFDYEKKMRIRPRGAMLFGSTLAVIFYLLFVFGILASGGEIVPDTLSGLVGTWPSWKLSILAWLGLSSLFTSYIPIGLEIRNSLHKDLRWNEWLTAGVVVLAPMLLYMAGLRNFISAIGLSGGIFLGLEYIFIVLVGRKVLTLRPIEKLFGALVMVMFAAAAIYEIYYFIVG